MQHSHWICLPLAAVSVSAFATTYLTVEQAQQAIFPGAQLAPAKIALSDDQAKQIEAMSGVPVHSRELKAWRVATGGWLLIDEVVGKHEAIQYAVGLTTTGSVKQVEIMDYRESYGYEVRNPNWRKQFVGKTASDPVKLNQDIANISGATFSCRHVTEGVKRLLATYAVALK